MKQETQEKGKLNLLEDKLMYNLFHEPSTRTKGSFHAAMMKLGGRVIPGNPLESSHQKGETLEDSISTVSQFVDLIVLRHSDPTSAARAAAVSPVPVINCGDGALEHPTQALLDLYCIKSCKGTIDGLTVVMVGDLKYGSSAHSLCRMLSLFDVKIHLVSPFQFSMPAQMISDLSSANVLYCITNDLQSSLGVADVLYVNRVQDEIIDSSRAPFIISKELVKSHCKSDMIIMHPLPRGQELSTDLDDDPRSQYFNQPSYGLYLRMGMLAACLGRI